MARWVRACGSDDFRKTHLFIHKRREYALFRLEDGIYCTENSCSHEYSSLSDGMIVGTDVYCPKHGSRFDIRTGAVRDYPATRPVKTFPVRVDENGDVLVQLK